MRKFDNYIALDAAFCLCEKYECRVDDLYEETSCASCTDKILGEMKQALTDYTDAVKLYNFIAENTECEV